MRFWDSSALVPLFVAERETARVARWADEDPAAPSRANLTVWPMEDSR